MDLFNENMKDFNDNSEEATENTSTDNNPSDNNSMDIGKILKLVELMQLFGSKKNSEEEVEEAFFDELIFSPQLKSVKAIVPYCDYNMQKNLALFVKILELKMVMEHYEKEETIHSIQSNHSGFCPDMIKSITPYMQDEHKHLISMASKFMDINKISSDFQNDKKL